MILASFVASFSFGTGLAVWAALLLLGYCFRLRTGLLLALGASAVITAAIYSLLPAREAGAHLVAGLDLAAPSRYLLLCEYFLRLLGSPFSYALGGWYNAKTVSADQFVTLSVFAGATGFLFAGGFLMVRVLRRDLTAGLEATGLGLIVFDFVAIGLITIGSCRALPHDPNRTQCSPLPLLEFAVLGRVALNRPTLR